MSTQAIDQQHYNDVALPETYADQQKLDAILTHMRANAPITLIDHPDFRPFWAISKHEDVVEIERLNDLFINDPRAVLADIATEQATLEFTGGNHLLLRTLIHMDNPDHKTYRGLTQDWFMPGSLRDWEPRFRELAKMFVERMAGMNGECDFVQDISIWYPLRVVMMILGVPEEDEARMLRLTQELFGAADEEMKRKEDATDHSDTISDFFMYFTQMTEDRRANPRDDAATLIANAVIDGEPIEHLEAMSYYIIIATAGHDTTSSSISGGLLALIENPEELAKLKADPFLIPSAVDEMIRWTTPVKHFMRTATEDFDIRGTHIKKGESVMLLYPSANRDEDVFDDPFAFRVDRKPNKHVAYGFGAHLCLGQYLAKLEMRMLLEELLPRLDEIELAGEPSLITSSFVSGLKHLPIRYKMR
jgi:cytochrome P450